MAKSPSEILSDPAFQALPLGEQLTVMKTADPNFAALPAKEQGTVIATARQKSLGYGQEQAKDPGFWKTLGSDIASIPGGIVHAVTSPIETGKALVNAQTGELRKARDAWNQGDLVTAGARGLAGLLPIVGPAAAQAGEDFGEGRPGAGAAHALELLGPSAAKLLPKVVPNSVKVSRSVKNVNNAVEERALSSVAPSVRMTPGQRAGQTGLQQAERNLRNMPGTATEAEQFYRGAQEDITKEGARRIGQQGQVPGATPQTTNAYGAGQAVQEALTDRVSNLKSYADKLYDSTRQTTARNAKEVQVGTKKISGPNPLATNHPSGWARSVPDMKTLETPVAIAPVRSQLKQVYQELSKNLPEAKRKNSPTYRALDELMTSDITHMNAMEFDKFLGAVKSLSRDGNSPLLSTQSQRIARQVIAAGESEFQAAMKDAGPNVLDKLQRARKAVREYHDTADFLSDLRTEPGSLYKNLTTGGDRVQNTLLDLKNKAPKALDTVGRTFLGELMDKATRDGGWARSAGVKADWERLGPETKNTLFGPKVTESLDDFFRAAKMLNVPEGSPTAGRLAAILSYGDIGTAIAEFATGIFTGHPLAGAAVGGATLLKTRVQPAILAKLSFKPTGAQLLKQSLTLPTGSQQWANTMRALSTMAAAERESSLNKVNRGPILPPQE